MPRNDLNAFGLGFAAGLRTVTPFAALALYGPRRLRRLRRPLGRRLATGLALAEQVNDKLPFTPARIVLPQLVGRLAAGATAAWLLTRRRSGLLLGALGAIAGTYGGYYARRALTKQARLRDLPVALVEDGLAVAIARRAIVH